MIVFVDNQQMNLWVHMLLRIVVNGPKSMDTVVSRARLYIWVVDNSF
jgi:hypothetical protein